METKVGKKYICCYISALGFPVHLFPRRGFSPFFYPPYGTNCHRSLPRVCGLGGKGKRTHDWSLISLFAGSYVPGSLWCSFLAHLVLRTPMTSKLCPLHPMNLAGYSTPCPAPLSAPWCHQHGVSMDSAFSVFSSGDSWCFVSFFFQQ